MSKILVTPRSVTKGGHPSLEALKEAGYGMVTCTPGAQPSEDELRALLPGCVGYLAGVERVSSTVLEAAPDLRVISRNGTGVDGIDLDAARRLGISVCRAEGANARGVAELTMGLILSLARSIPACDRAIKAGDWERRKGLELEGRTLGVVGCGQIGRIVARLGLGFGMNVIAHDPYPNPDFAPGAAFRYGSLGEIVEMADVITLHCPPADGRPVLDATALERVKKGVLVVNTARPSLVDRTALAQALDSGRVGGAALDVFETEPPGEDPLLINDRVIATPHIGGFTDESVDRAMYVAVDNLLNALKGVEMRMAR